MMNKVKEALERLELRSDISPNDPHINTLVDLAESVLSVAGKMPEKKKHSDWDCGDAHCIVCEDRGYNNAIEECTLAFAGMIPEAKAYPFMSSPDVNLSAAEVKGWNACRDAIINSIKGE